MRKSSALSFLVVLFCLCARANGATTAEQQFQAGLQAWRSEDFSRAAEAFQESAAAEPAAGTYEDLGDAEWQRGRTGRAILAWERALWLSPSDAGARNNLQFARNFGQIEAPELTWYEVVSTWMPSGCWALLTTIGLWLLADMLALPGILRRRRAGWPQSFAAIGLTLLLLTLPAHLGWHTRARIGFVLEPNTPLRLTPTETAQEITRVGAGEPGRFERQFGNYYYVRFHGTGGWLTREEFGLVHPR